MSVQVGRVLVVDDDSRGMGWIDRWLNLEGFEVHRAYSYAEGVNIASEIAPDFAVIDLVLPDGHGLDLIRHVKKVAPHSRVILVTGFGSIATAVEAMRLGAADYLLKPVEPDELVAALKPAKTNGVPTKTPELPTLDRVQWDYIQRVLAYCNGNISETARRLGKHRQSLQRMLRRYPPRK